MKNNYYLGGDVSKGYADFVILGEKKNIVEENFQLDDTFEGHHQLFKILRRFFELHPEAQLFAALESTGGYENNWYCCLKKYQSQFNIHVSRLNPFGVNHNSKATLERNITDKKSAVNIADYLISHPEKAVYDRADYFGPQRKLWMFIKMLTKQKTQLSNQLHAWLYTANPEIVHYCKDGLKSWILKMLLKYPNAKKLAKARVESLSKIPFVTKAKAVKLIRDAKVSVASDNDELTAELIISLAGQILALQKQIYIQNKILAQNCKLPELDILTTFNGIGAYSAVGLMIEIVDVTRFASSKKLASFFGLHPVYKQSGDGLSGYRMSKRGRKEPRNLLYNVARMAIIHNPLIKEIYAKFLSRSMNKSAAIGALMHKIIRIIFGMLKNNTAFDPEIDRKNRQRHILIRQTNKPNENRRYLELTTSAPISRRQYKKRKELNSSQDEQLSSYAGSSSSSLL